ncbi:DEAD/DEAH box helicase [Schaalia sp. 19OD2882]|uniref:DEAD/DEAH box helicase n=1 Tax=Schaalia sp. 19OD2882 TaxID=2794089 RepID=UPI001C1EEBC7|nr:DEAD/DEAH box helicase [Schaalia sp. 19OD2882]QWW18735.1 DEAD/DEAH box helicase [Schaalia sp. 19OD2882]
MGTNAELRAAIAALDDSDIMAMVGPATWGAALVLRKNGSPAQVEDLEDGRIRGRVAATGVTYSAWVGPGPGAPLLTCACSIGRDCKHALSVLLEVQEAERRRAETTPERDWRDTLADLVGGSGATGEPLALLVDASDPSQPVRLSPLRPGRTVTWTAKRASWADITSTQWASVVEGLNPTHICLMREGYRLSREGVAWRSRGEVCLEDLGEGAIPWLRQLVRSGVTLLAALDPLTPLHLDPASWDLALDAHLGPKGLHLEVVATLGDEIRPTTRLSADHGLLLLDGGTRIAHVRVGETFAALLPDGLHVPAADLAEFRTRWFDRTRSQVRILSSDASFSAEVEQKCALVATVRVEHGRGLAVRWWVEYDFDGARSRTLLDPAASDPDLREICARVDAQGRRAAAHWWQPGPSTIHLQTWRAPELLAAVEAIRDPDLIWDVSDEVRAIQVDPEGMRVDLVVDEDDQHDWFGLRMRILLAGHEVEIREVLDALAREQDHVEVDGVWVRLDGQRIETLRALLAQAATLTDSDPEAPRLRPIHLGVLDGVSDMVDTVCAAPKWRERVDALTQADVEARLPASTRARVDLRPYQEQGRQWLVTRAMLGLGGILADDMGLGKTIQILSALLSLKEAGLLEGPVLVVTPTSVLPTWRDEAASRFPDLVLRVVSATGRRREENLSTIADGADVLVVSYTLVRLEAQDWAEVALGGLVLDEAQAVKNPSTAIHGALRALETPWTFAVTGTPVENSLGDLWSVLALATPGLLPGQKAFNERFRKPVEAGDRRMLTRLHALVGPFVLRRTKDEVAPDLPDKTVQVVPIDLGVEHRRIYEQYLTRERARILGLMKDMRRNRMDVLASLTRLRLLALDPALVDERHAGVGSAKVEYLADQLDQLLPLGHKVLVFSQFTSFLTRVRLVVERRGHTVAELTGATRDREAAVGEFRGGEAPVFLISLKAGGTGLTLTEADYVFLMDPWWNPAVEAQAIDRAHRIGQTKKVNVYRLAACDTVEQKVLALQERKRELVSAVVDGGASGTRISVADLRALLES